MSACRYERLNKETTVVFQKITRVGPRRCLMNFRRERLTIFVLTLIAVICGCGKREHKRITLQMDAEERFWIRVLLLDDVKQCKLGADAPWNISIAGRIEYALDTKQTLSIKVSAEGFVVSGRILKSREIIISSNEPHILSLNRRKYRGKLKLILNEDRTSFDAINFVPLEPYLAGVVGAEMPYYWEPMALQSQAIAARTYCLYIKQRFGIKRDWDVRGTQAHQVYLGIAGESSQVWDAVNKTNGLILVLNDSNDEITFPTYYSSVCGGHTEQSGEVFGDSHVSLNAVVCDYCKYVARPEFFFWPQFAIEKRKASDKLIEKYSSLKKLERIDDIVVTKQSDYGTFSRMTRIKLVGSNGKTDSLRAEDLRLSLDPSGKKLRSTICRIETVAGKWVFVSGRGFGHGVGMCQCGAQAQARAGKSATEILNYYYPKSMTVSVY